MAGKVGDVDIAFFQQIYPVQRCPKALVRMTLDG